MASEPATERTPLTGGVQRCTFDTAFRVRLLTAIASLAEGYDIGIVNGAIISMRKDLKLTDIEVGLAVAVTVIFSALSVILAGSVADALGRKKAVGISSLALFASSLMWALCQSFLTLLLARAMLGVGLGIGIATVTIYISEVAPAHARGFYASLEELFLNIGIPLGFISAALLLGIPYDWRIMVALGAIPAGVVAIAVLTPYFPESPRFLLSQGKHEEAEQVLLDLLHGDREETNRILDAWDHVNDKTCTWAEAMEEFRGPHRKMAIAGFGVACTQMACGIAVVTVFSSMMLGALGMSDQEALDATVFIGLVKMLAIVLSAFVLLDRWGRRPLLILSGSLCAVSAAMLSLFCTWRVDPYLIAMGLALFSAGFSVGMGPATFVYIAEVFSTKVRGKGVATSLFVSRLIHFLYALVTPLALAQAGVASIWTFLAAMNVCITAFFVFFCPETAGLTLEQMKEAFNDDDEVAETLGVKEC